MWQHKGDRRRSEFAAGSGMQILPFCMSLQRFPANSVSHRKPNHVPLEKTDPGGLRTKAQPDPATLTAFLNPPHTPRALLLVGLPLK